MKTVSNNGLFHLISIHPLWMTFKECPGRYFEACPGGSKTNFNDGKGGILCKFDCVGGKSVTNYGVQGDALPIKGAFQSKS